MVKGKMIIPNVKLMSCRKLEGMKQSELAEKVNRSLSFMSRVEQGREKPSKALAIDIARVLEADPEELFPEVFQKDK